MADEKQAEMAEKQAEVEKTDADTQPNPADLAAELEKTRKALKEANREAADRRKRLEALEAAESERKQAEMTEAQKLQARIEKLEAEKTEALTRAQTATKRAAIVAKAGAFIDPEDVVGALLGKVQLNDAGEVEGLDDALKELGKAKPHWLKGDKPAPRLNAGNPGNAHEQGETDAQRRARIYGGGGSPFDAARAAGHGGGVVWNTDNHSQ